MSSEIDFLFSRDEDAKYVNDFVLTLTDTVSTILNGHVDGDERKRVVCKILLGPMYTGNHKSIHNYFKTNWVDTLTLVTAVGGENGDASIVVSNNVTAFATDGSSISGPNIPLNTRILKSTYFDSTTINLDNNLTGVVSDMKDAYKITKPVPKTLLEHLNNDCPGQFLFLGINNLTSIFSHLEKHNIRKRVRRIQAKAVVVCTITCITTTENKVLINRWDREDGTEVQISGTSLPKKTVVLTLEDPHDEFLNEKKFNFTILSPTIAHSWTGHFTKGDKIYITGVNKKKFNLLKRIVNKYARQPLSGGNYMLTVHIGKFTSLANI